jgi:hypothetical protein
MDGYGLDVLMCVRLGQWFSGGILALMGGVVTMDLCDGFFTIVGLGASEMLLFGSLGLPETGEGWARI